MATKMGAKRTEPRKGLRRKPVVPKASSLPKKSKSKPKRGAPTTKKVDDLWSLVVRERAIYECQMFGCGGMQCSSVMHAHHIFGRGFSVRWNLENGLSVCGAHHLYYIHNGNKQAQAQEDVREIIGSELYEKLDKLSRKTGKNSAPYRTEMFEKLTAELARLKKAA